MGPRTSENNIDRNERSHHDIDEDFENGWTIGYDVQIQGVGVVDVGTFDLSDDDVANDDGDDDDDVGCNCSFSSDNSDNETKRDGYRPLLCDAVAGEPLNEEEILGERSEYTTTTNFLKLVEQMPPPPEDNFQREISHKPVDITLDEDKINQIRSAMSKINIKPPPWADSLEDKKLAELVQNLKKSV